MNFVWAGWSFGVCARTSRSRPGPRPSHSSVIRRTRKAPRSRRAPTEEISRPPLRRFPRPGAISLAWRTSSKVQPANTKFKVSSVDAPNVNGARALNLLPGAVGDPQGRADVAALKAALETGNVTALYVFDPGPDGSIGDARMDCGRAGEPVACRCSIVQGVLLTGAGPRWRISCCPAHRSSRKRRLISNEQGRLQATVAGDRRCRRRRWRTGRYLVNLGDRSRCAARVQGRCTGPGRYRPAPFGDAPALAGITTLDVRPARCRRVNWLQASNPSERWKWDFMFQDLPPVKGAVDPIGAAAAAGAHSAQRSEVRPCRSITGCGTNNRRSGRDRADVCPAGGADSAPPRRSHSAPWRPTACGPEPSCARPCRSRFPKASASIRTSRGTKTSSRFV